MCEHHDHSDSSGVGDFEIQDVAGATLTLVGALVERYIGDDYCDPLMYKALQASRLLATRLAELADEQGDTDTAEQARELVTSFEVTLIEAGEVMNEIIERHDLPVLKNTFEVNREHPKFMERLGEE